MSNVYRMPAVPDAPPGEADADALKRLRRRYRLTITQVAQAMDVSTGTVEAWERGLNSPPDPEIVEQKLVEFEQANPSKQEGKNLLFGYYPLRLARELIGLDVVQMGARFGHSKSSWTKIEANFRTVSPDVLSEIEELVRAKLAEVCGP